MHHYYGGSKIVNMELLLVPIWDNSVSHGAVLLTPYVKGSYSQFRIEGLQVPVTHLEWRGSKCLLFGMEGLQVPVIWNGSAPSACYLEWRGCYLEYRGSKCLFL